MIKYFLKSTQFGNYIILKLEVKHSTADVYLVMSNSDSYRRMSVPHVIRANLLYDTVDEAKSAARQSSDKLKENITLSIEKNIKKQQDRLEKLKNHTPGIRVINLT